MAEKKGWICKTCDYIHRAPEPPDRCPVCCVGPQYFAEWDGVERDRNQENRAGKR